MLSTPLRSREERHRRAGSGDGWLGFATEVGLPITLADIGLADLSQEQLHTIAVRATAEGETIHNEPFDVSSDMVADAIMAADAAGRAWKKGCRRE